jgi:large subunit ribosomal protein L13
MAQKTTPMHMDDSVGGDWHVIDCTDQPVGRLATQVADILRGKHKPTYTPNQDTGDFVVAINVEKIQLTGNKWDKKMYWSHSGYVGGIKGLTAREMLEKHPEDILRKAVKGMLPRNRLAAHIIKKLKIYTGAAHPHGAQKPAA